MSNGRTVNAHKDEEDDMQTRTQMEVTPNDLELWTLDDAEAWKEAEGGTSSDLWMDEEQLLEDDLWMDGADSDSLSFSGLGRVGIRLS